MLNKQITFLKPAHKKMMHLTWIIKALKPNQKKQKWNQGNKSKKLEQKYP